MRRSAGTPTILAAFVAILGFSVAEPARAQTAFDFAFTSIEGEVLPLSRYAGKALLVVNTASFCGFTKQYAALQELWARYRDRGLVVLGVPSNDFGGQEPGSSEEIKEFCEVNFGIDFPLSEKVAVRSPGAHPFYVWARDRLGAEAAPRWNFHKYLVDPEGRLVAWFPSAAEQNSDAILSAIDKTLPKAPGS